MDAIGFRFFEGFVGLVARFQWVLIAIFVAFIGRQLWRFRPEERLQSLLMYLYFFLVITVFWVLKPLKKGMFLTFYAEAGGLDLLGWHLPVCHTPTIVGPASGSTYLNCAINVLPRTRKASA